MLSIAYAVSCNSTSPAPYFHQRTIRTFIQRSRLSLVARSSSGHRQFTDKYPHNLPTRSHASSCSDRRRRKYHFKQDTFATITPPKPGAIMDLSTGIITSEVSYDKAADMGNQRLHRTIYYVTRKELLSHDFDTGADGKRRKLFTYLHHSAPLHPTTSCQPEIHTFSGQLSIRKLHLIRQCQCERMDRGRRKRKPGYTLPQD